MSSSDITSPGVHILCCMAASTRPDFTAMSPRSIPLPIKLTGKGFFYVLFVTLCCGKLSVVAHGQVGWGPVGLSYKHGQGRTRTARQPHTPTPFVCKSEGRNTYKACNTRVTRDKAGDGVDSVIGSMSYAYRLIVSVAWDTFDFKDIEYTVFNALVFNI